MPKIGLSLRLKLGERLPLQLIPDEDAPSGGWRSSVTSVVGSWVYGYGETTVSGELDMWEDEISGEVVSAVSSTQRPADSGTAWVFDDSTNDVLLGAATMAALLEGSAHTLVARCEVDDTAGHTPVCVGSNGSVHRTNMLTTVTLNLNQANLRGVGGAIGSNSTTALVVNTPSTMGLVYDGSDLNSYVDGVDESTTAISGENPTSLNRVCIGARYQNGSFALYHSGPIYGILISTAGLDSTEMASIHSNYAAEY